MYKNTHGCKKLGKAAFKWVHFCLRWHQDALLLSIMSGFYRVGLTQNRRQVDSRQCQPCHPCDSYGMSNFRWKSVLNMIWLTAGRWSDPGACFAFRLRKQASGRLVHGTGDRQTKMFSPVFVNFNWYLLLEIRVLCEKWEKVTSIFKTTMTSSLDWRWKCTEP